ncbi:Large proline-rich protein bag6 [Salvia divinorum]|uniref:Large proline-rich protein bag6 n=1 Tax=Salvia divinorum TaxID=28513 RepID=A0ABD1GQG9_SALDI
MEPAKRYPGTGARPPVSCESWPWGGNYGYAPPGVCHTCCNHAYMPAPGAWGSPYSHVPLPPHQFPRHYPHSPIHYMPPPSHTMIHHPRYEYERSVPMEHRCCGCRNHPPHQKEQRNAIIEEQEPEREPKKNDSLVPKQFKNPPYPIVWLPPDHNEGGKVKNTEVRKDASLDVTRESEVEGWRCKTEFGTEKGSGGDQNFQVDGGNIGFPCASRVKDIPVKDVEQQVRKGSPKNMEKEGDASVKIRNDNGEKRIDKVEKVSPTEGSKRKSLSPPKSSKLPHVCLRVDPLPRKKSANAKSRSPSPPGDKQKLEVTTVETPVKPPAKYGDDVSTKQAEEKPEEETERNHSETYAAIKEQSEDIVSTGGEKEVSFRDEKAGAGKKCCKRELSEEEATVIIQSAYQHFDVGRWKPIEKLRQIARPFKAEHYFRNNNELSAKIGHNLGTASNHQGNSSSISKDVVSSENNCKINLVDSQSQIKERSSPEKAEFSEVNPVDEAANVITRAEAAESCVDEGLKSEEDQTAKDGDEKSTNPIDEAASVERGVEAAENPVEEGVKSEQGSATKDEDENSYEVFENEETPIAKEDCEPIILGQGCELSPLLDDSSARATDVAQTEDQDTFRSEMAELPQVVVDDLCASERTDHSADSSKSELSWQLEEVLHSADSSNDDQHPKIEEGTNHTADSSKVELSRQLEEVLHSADLSKADQHPQLEEGTDHSADSSKAELSRQLEEVLHSADSSKADQHPQLEEGMNHLADSSKADQQSHLEEALAGSHTIEESHCEIVNEENHLTETEEEEDHKIGDAASESNNCTFQQSAAHKLGHSEAYGEREVTSNEESHENSQVGDSTSEEMTGQLVQEGNIEERGFTDEDAVSIARVESTAAAKSCDGMADVEQGAADANHSRGVSEDEENNAVGDEMRESNRKLMEEEERLREMMAKLIETGQEQLTAISSLSGRVKELEKKLNRKKKLKVRKFRAPRSSSCITKFDTWASGGGCVVCRSVFGFAKTVCTVRFLCNKVIVFLAQSFVLKPCTFFTRHVYMLYV